MTAVYSLLDEENLRNLKAAMSDTINCSLRTLRAFNLVACGEINLL
jgi:hypothetical protein